MNKYSSIILTAIAVLLLQGCTSKLSMIIWSSDELTIERFEKEIVTYDNWTPAPGTEEDPPERWGLINVCNSYFRQRQLSTALECAQAYEQHHLPLIPEEVSGRWRAFDAGNYRYQFHSTMLQIYLELGDYEKAQYHADQGIDEAINKWGGIQWTGFIAQHARFLANASIAFEKSGDHTRALELVPYIPLIDYNEGLLSPVTSKEVKVKHTQEAKAWIALGEYDRAEDALNRAMGNKEWALRGILFLQTLGVSELAGAGEEMTNPFSIDELFMASKIALMKKDYDSARPGYDYILKGDYSDHKHAMQTPINKRKGLHYLVLYDRAQIALYDKDYNLAESLLRQALDIIESQRALINTESSKIGFVGDKQAVYRDLIHLLVKTSKPGEAFLIVERSKARALVDMLASKDQFSNDHSPRRNTQELIAELNTAESSEMIVNSKIKNSPNNTTKTRSSDDIRAQIVLNEPEFASLVTVQKPTLEALESLYPPMKHL